MRKIPALLIICMLFFGLRQSRKCCAERAGKFKYPKTDPRIGWRLMRRAGLLLNGVGVAGIIIYRQADGSYVAYDRCSSYQPEKLCAITVDDTGFTATDPCSGSKFSLTDGGPVKAPATKYLRAYIVNTTQFEIFVSN
jgi:nitrite reductase/ring-hydroxylating ferredoxin subunit